MKTYEFTLVCYPGVGVFATDAENEEQAWDNLHEEIMVSDFDFARDAWMLTNPDSETNTKSDG